MTRGEKPEEKRRRSPRPSRSQSDRRSRRPSRRRSRRRGRLTREGKAFVFVTVGVGIAAVNTGNNLLYLMLALMLSTLLLSMVMSEVALARIRVRRRLPERCFAGTTCLVEVALSNDKKRLNSFSLEVEDRAADEPTERRCYFLKVGPKSEQVAAYRRTPRHRGVLELTGFRLGTRYPFGLVEKARLIDEPAELLVYPRLVQVRAAELHGALDGSERPSQRVGPGTEVAGIRTYRSGDEARAIHWRRTASLGRLVVREHERDSASRLTMVIDNARPEGATDGWDRGFEHAVSRAASVAASAVKRHMAVEVLARGTSSPLVLPGTAPDPVWRWLALLEPVPADGAEPLPARRGALVIDVRPARDEEAAAQAEGDGEADGERGGEGNGEGDHGEGVA